MKSLVIFNTLCCYTPTSALTVQIMKNEQVDCHVINEALQCLEQEACLSTGTTTKCQCDFGYGHGTKNYCLRCPQGTGTDTTNFTCQQCPDGQLSMYRATCVTPSNCTDQNGVVNSKKKTCDCPDGTYYDPTLGCVNLKPDTSLNCSAISSKTQCIAQQTCQYRNNKCSCSPYYPVANSSNGGCTKCPYGQVYSTTNGSCHTENVVDGQTVSPGQTLIFDYTQCETIGGYLVGDAKTQCLCKQGLQYFAYKEACIIPLNLQKGSGSGEYSILGILVVLSLVVLLCFSMILIRKTNKQYLSSEGKFNQQIL